MRTRCETCGRTWGAEEPLGLKAEATVTSCAMCLYAVGAHLREAEYLRPGPMEPTHEAVLGKLLPENVYEMASAASIEKLREAYAKLQNIGRPALGSVIFVRQETLDELRKLPVQRAEHITPMQKIAHSFERIEVRVWDEARLGPITDEELARINDLIEKGVLRA